MSRERQRWQDRAGQRARLWVVGVGALAVALIGFGASTCGIEDSALDRCDVDADCSHLPTTICMDNLCTCPGLYDEWCRGTCRPSKECRKGWSQGSGGAGGAGGPGGAGGGGGSGSTSGSGGSGGSGGAVVECMTAADCPQPGNPHCGKATCKNGECKLTFSPAAELQNWQVQGDCKSRWCDGAGNVYEVEAPNDTYNDGLQCMVDTCEAGVPKQTALPTGVTCPEAGSGSCHEGECVLCVEGTSVMHCDPNIFVCQGVSCRKKHCANKVWDPADGETGKDCGGVCTPCEPGNPCKVPGDCLHKICTDGVCQFPTCSDGAKNADETGVDCGGPPTCPRCPPDQRCKLPSDCIHGVCWAGKCKAPTCLDGVKNGDETEWDCGGSCKDC